ncbi:MAG: hypothetical protein MT490_05570 [Sphingomonas sp.]|uniref:ExbD/TolR family protein n=1 Tax=Sphingomonas sp. TaxID=28214 RepID=UPI002272ACF0|nr:hypothetical protein [Sphingomonas sp.]MCX8475250.1 hypothetical protein [Sphingomonas sp.]
MIALLFGLLAGPMQTAERVRVEVTWDGQDCGASADGERLSMNDLEARSARWARDGRAASVFWARDVPYRCIGGAIYLLQRGGVSEVASDWPGTTQVSITIPAGRCRIAVNGHPTTLARLRKEAAKWKETQPEVHFLPSPEAEYRCVDRVLQVLRDASLTKLGFIGNEEASEEGP